MRYGKLPAEQIPERTRARVHRWLEQYGRSPAELARMTPLLEARYAARYRSYRIQYATVLVLVAAMLGWVGWQQLTGTDPLDTPGSLTVMVTVMVVLYGSALAAAWYQRRADRRLGAALRHRVARSAAVDLPGLLGRWFVVTTAVSCGGGLLVAGLAAATAGSARDSALAAAFGAGVVAFIVLGAAALADVARRPAVAEDDRSLAEDDTLRREDALTALAPWPALLALAAGAGSAAGPLVAAYLAYAGAAALTWLAWWRATVRARRAGTAGWGESRP